MIFIQESKSDTLTDMLKLSIWDDSHKWLESPAVGQSEGLAITIHAITVLYIPHNSCYHNYLYPNIG